MKHAPNNFSGELMKRFAAASSLLLVLACTSAAPPAASPAASGSYGTTKEAAIEVCKPEGERRYLRRLRCADGSAPEFSRDGSGGSRTDLKTPEDERKSADQMFGDVKPGDADYHVIDYYTVRCGDRETTLILDMYHCKQPEPSQAPAGFTLATTP